MDLVGAVNLARDPLPLRGTSVVVTGVSRRARIGFATACRSAAYGASVFCHPFAPHDREQPWGGDDLDAVLDGVRAHLVGDARVADLEDDLSDPEAPGRVIGAAIAGVTLTVANQLADRGIRVNAVNPGPIDTGYLTEDARRALRPMFPLGRFGEPDDAARLVAWLVTDEAAWVTGQVLHSEGGSGRGRATGR